MDYVLPLEEVSVYVTEDSCTPALLLYRRKVTRLCGAS